MMTIGWVFFCARALTMFAISERSGGHRSLFSRVPVVHAGVVLTGYLGCHVPPHRLTDELNGLDRIQTVHISKRLNKNLGAFVKLSCNYQYCKRNSRKVAYLFGVSNFPRVSSHRPSVAVLRPTAARGEAH